MPDYKWCVAMVGPCLTKVLGAMVGPCLIQVLGAMVGQCLTQLLGVLVVHMGPARIPRGHRWGSHGPSQDPSGALWTIYSLNLLLEFRNSRSSFGYVFEAKNKPKAGFFQCFGHFWASKTSPKLLLEFRNSRSKFKE